MTHSHSWLPWQQLEILVRMYEVGFELNGRRTRQYVITHGGSEQAKAQIAAEYPGAKVRLRRSRLIAAAYRWALDSRAWSEISAHDNLRGQEIWRGHYQWWTGRLLHAARRVAAGKCLEPSTSGERIGSIAGWPFKHVRRILRQDRGDGLTVPEVAEMFPDDLRFELADIITRLEALGYLRREGHGWWRVTPRGRRLRDESEGRLSRGRAMQLIADLRARIRAVNANPELVYRVSTAVVFGSVLASKSKVGDVDVALELLPRHRDPRQHERAFHAAQKRTPGRIRTIFESVGWPETEVRRAVLRGGQGRISIRTLEEFGRVLEAEQKRPKYEVIFGSWRAPRRPPRRRVPVSTRGRILLRQLAAGGVLHRRWLPSGERYRVGSRRVDALAVEELLSAGVLSDREPVPGGNLVTNEWVLSGAGYASLARGFFLVRGSPGHRNG